MSPILSKSVPDQDVANESFYLWRDEYQLKHWRPALAVGQHLQAPKGVGSEVLPYDLRFGGFWISRSPDFAGGDWPGRLFRVGEVKGLNLSTKEGVDLGSCAALTVLEELSPSLAFGPGGKAAAAITERAVSLSAYQIEALGEVAQTFGTDLLHEDPGLFPLLPPDSDLRHRFEQVVARFAWPRQSAWPRNLEPMAKYVSQRWIDVAHRTDPKTGSGHLLSSHWLEYPGIHTFVAWSWKQALMAFHSALRAALWSDLVEPDVYQWLIEPWSAGMAAIDTSVPTDS